MLRAGRINQIINLPFPGKEELRLLIQKKINDLKLEVEPLPPEGSDEEDAILKLCEGQTGSYIEELVIRASMWGWNVLKLQPAHDITHMSQRISPISKDLDLFFKQEQGT